MHVIFGLGNPGSEYDGTRHNIGFAVIDALAEKLDVAVRPGPGDYLIGKARTRGGPVALVKPLTYMNNAGLAAREIVERNSLPLARFLVLADDFHIPLGMLRLRGNGSDGGHNGLYSIIYHVQSDEFPRLRCGIAGPSMPVDKKQLSGFVLSLFEKEERPLVNGMIRMAVEAALVTVTQDLQTAMNRFNN